MKIIFFLLLFFTARPALRGQVAIQLTKMNTAYCDVDNPLRIACTEIDNGDLVLVSDNGTVANDYGQLSFRPYHAGRATVKVFERTSAGQRLADSFLFHIKDIPKPIAKLAGHYTGSMPAGSMRIQIAPSAVINGFDIEAKVKIICFTVALICDSELVAESHLYNPTAGCRFSDDETALKIMRDIRPRDVLWIRDIVAAKPSGKGHWKLNEIRIVAE